MISSMKAYTGVGSRETPEDVMLLMTKLAAKLEAQGWTLRSGAADGADTGFENGVSNPENKEIFIAWNGFSGRKETEEGVYCLKGEITQQAETIAAEVHPAWDRLSHGARGLHSRNCFQVLGSDLSSPSKFLVCWAQIDKHGVPKGGTRTSWVLATQNNIPCYNLIIPEHLERISKYLEEV